MSREAQYIALFVGAGIIAVGIKAASDHWGTRAAGLVAMAPLKILFAWAVVASDEGRAGIVGASSSMLLGLVALLLTVLTGLLLGSRLPAPVTIAAGATVWLATVLGLGLGEAEPHPEPPEQEGSKER